MLVSCSCSNFDSLLIVCCIGGPKISTQQSAKEFMRKTILLIVITDLELLWQYRVSIVHQLIEIMTNIYSFLIVTGNQENLLQLRQQLILDQSSAKKNANELRTGTKQKTRRSLVYPEGDNTQEASFPVVAKKRKPNPAEKQLVKVKHLSLMCLRVLPFCALFIVTCFNSSHAVGNVFMVS